MKKILVTGGLGFIGFHFVKQLAEKNRYEIVVADNREYFFEKGRENYRYYLALREKELARLHIPVTVVPLHQSDEIKKIYHDHSPDIVVHFAGLPVAGIADYFPELARTHIFDTTFHLLDIFADKRPEQFIYISSSMVYGDFPKDKRGAIVPPAEDFPCMPTDIYGSLKLCCENMVRAFHLRKKLTYTIIRPSAVYGFTDCNFRVTELFAARALTGQPLLLDNGGRHLLDFTWVGDLAKGIGLAVENESALNETFNMSCGQGRSIAELAAIIASEVPGTIIKETSCKPFRPNRGAMNISKAKLKLGFSPEYPLERGMKEYTAAMKEHLPHLHYPEKYY
jgi:UDP-glucose 4-epimerase